MHFSARLAVAEVMSKRGGYPAAAATTSGYAIHGYPNFSPLLTSLAVELVKAGEIEDAKWVVKKARELDLDLKLMVHDDPGFDAIW